MCADDFAVRGGRWSIDNVGGGSETRPGRINTVAAAYATPRQLNGV